MGTNTCVCCTIPKLCDHGNFCARRGEHPPRIPLALCLILSLIFAILIILANHNP